MKRTVWEVNGGKFFATEKAAKSMYETISRLGCTVYLDSQTIDTTPEGEIRWQEIERLEKEAK